MVRTGSCSRGENVWTYRHIKKKTCTIKWFDNPVRSFAFMNYTALICIKCARSKYRDPTFVDCHFSGSGLNGLHRCEITRYWHILHWIHVCDGDRHKLMQDRANSCACRTTSIPSRQLAPSQPNYQLSSLCILLDFFLALCIFRIFVNGTEGCQ